MLNPRAVTNKTEFMRYLDAHPKTVPALRKYIPLYLKCGSAANCFGLWVRNKHQTNFNAAFDNFWMKKPKLWGKIYEEATPL